MDARGGLATFRTLYLDSACVKVTGSGTINLADEALSLRLRPLERLADTGVTVPRIVGATIEHANHQPILSATWSTDPAPPKGSDLDAKTPLRGSLLQAI